MCRIYEFSGEQPSNTLLVEAETTTTTTTTTTTGVVVVVISLAIAIQGAATAPRSLLERITKVQLFDKALENHQMEPNHRAKRNGALMMKHNRTRPATLQTWEQTASASHGFPVGFWNGVCLKCARESMETNTTSEHDDNWCQDTIKPHWSTLVVNDRFTLHLFASFTIEPPINKKMYRVSKKRWWKAVWRREFLWSCQASNAGYMIIDIHL